MASKSIIEAILAVRKEVPTLGKKHDNEYSGYKYVSIDQFYETITPIATKAGLVWRARMAEWKVNPDMGKSGAVESRVVFDLYHSDGTEFLDYMSVPIINSLVGAQTTGQIMSYAEKVFMRSTFDVPTGEKDADHTDQAYFSRENRTEASRPAPEAPSSPVPLRAGSTSSDVRDVPHDKETGEVIEFSSRQTKEGLPIFDTRSFSQDAVSLVEKIFETWMAKPKTKTQLRNWFAENVPAMEKIGSYDPSAQDRLKAKFKEQAAKLPD